MSAPQRHRLTRAALLRALLRDGAWHTGRELSLRVGWRFSAAILTVRRGEDGRAPWWIERRRLNKAGTRHEYRFVEALRPEEVPAPTGTRADVARLKQRVADLERENQALRKAMARRGAA